MIALLRSISADGAASYRVILEDDDRTTRAFVLTVEGDDIQCVTWGRDFAGYVGHDLAPASRLFEAVLAFHRARRVTRG